VTFLAWTPLIEINTDLGIKSVVQFSSPFLHKSGNTHVSIKKTLKRRLPYVKMCITRFLCNIETFDIHSNWHFRHGTVTTRKSGLR